MAVLTTSFPAGAETGSTTAASRQPYASANGARRLFEGLFSGWGDEGMLPQKNPFGGQIPATARSSAIVEDALIRLQPDLAAVGLRAGSPMLLRLFKEEGELEIWMKPEGESLYALFRILRLSAVAGSPGPKLREGDGQAPEGFYEIARGALIPETGHHLGLDIGYPNPLDRALGRNGNGVWIHGGGTNAAGGYALSATAIEEVYALADASLRHGADSIPVHLFPFRLTDSRMDRVVAEGGRWTDFWVSLKEGYDFFDNVRLPPAVEMSEGRPRFEIARRD